MASRVAAVDWSATPLGPAETWPQSLQTALSICLSSRFPLLVWWGPQLTNFYNDAYLPLLGTKHPTALGQPASQTWAEAWGELGPLADRVMAGGAATFSEDRLLFLQRHGYLEETYWTFSYSPIRDESGGVGGVFVAVSDTTSRVLGERRLRILRELGELSAATSGTVAEAYRGAIEVLARYRASVPFALAYVRDDDGELRLVAGTGIRPGSDAAPATLTRASPWLGADGEPVGGLRDRWSDWLEPGPLGGSVPDQALVFPLVQGGEEQPVGLLVAGVNPYRELDHDYRSFYELVAGHVATAVTDTLAYQAERRRAERQTLLAEIGTVLDAETDVQRQLDRLARLLVDRNLADDVSIRRIAGDGSPPSNGGRRMAIPLTVRGRVLAVLAVARRGDGRPYTADERALGEEIAVRAALSLDNAVLLAEERAAAVRLALLQRVTAELSAARTPVQVAEAAVTHVRQIVGDVDVIGFFELDPQQRVLRRLAVLGTDQEDERWTEVPLSDALPITIAAVEHRPLWPEDVSDGAGAEAAQPEWLEEVRARLDVRGSAALPLIALGQVVGVIGMGLSTRRPLQDADRSMLLAVAEQSAQALDRARLYRAEQRIAETLQHSLLPQQLPVLERLSLAARYLAGAEGTQAGGDWYDVVELGGSRVAIAVGDVVGQGPAAAAVMGQLRSALSTALLQGHSPAAALEVLDRFARRLPGAVASSAACLVIDWSSGEVCWARAGHLPPLLVPRDPVEGVRVLDEGGSGTVLGVLSRPPFADANTTIEPGDTLLLYTDGLVERRGQPVDTGIERLASILRDSGSPLPEPLATRILRLALSDEQPDDVALMVARLLPAPIDEWLAAQPAGLAALRRRVQAWSQAQGLASHAAEDLQLALGEAVSNAVEHAYRDGREGSVEVRLALAADGDVHALVRDFGRWRPTPTDRGFRGRGLEMIRALAGDVVLETPDDGAGGTRLTFSFPLPALGRAAEGALRERPLRRPQRGTSPETGLTTHRDGEGLSLSIHGEVDLATAGTLRPALLAELAAGPGEGSDHARTDVVLDLTRTSYLASAGLGLLLELAEAAQRQGLRLGVRTDPDGVPARVLALAGLDALLRPAGPVTPAG